MRWNTFPAANGQTFPGGSATLTDLPATASPAGAGTQLSHPETSARAAKLLLFAAGASLLAGRLAKIVLRSWRGTAKAKLGNSFNQANLQLDPGTGWNNEERIEIAAERKEWK